MNEVWQKDWTTFLDLVGEEIRNGATTEQLSQRFGDTAVAWRGSVCRKELDELAPAVIIDLPSVHLDLGPLGSARLDRQSVPAARDAISTWDKIPEGATIAFSAVLGAKESLFPAVELIQVPGDGVIIMIRLSEGRPLGS